MLRFAHYIYLIPLLVSSLYSIKSFRQEWAKPYKAFSVFLMATFLLEILAISWKLSLHQTSYWGFSKSNLWIYNLYFVPQYLFYLIFYSSVLKSEILNKMKWLIFGLYFIFSVVNMVFIQTMDQLDTYNIIFGGVIVIMCSAKYFVQEFNGTMTNQVKSEPLFWISLGSLMFHCVSLPYFIFINYLSRTDLSLAIVLFNILLVLNILMYSFYLIAFLCNSPTRKRSS